MKEPWDLWLTIVGVAADAHQSTLETAPKPEMYLPHTQFRGLWAAPRELVVRSAADPLALAPAVRAIIHAVDPDQPISQVRTMGAVVGSTLTARRLQASLFGGFAVLGLGLAGAVATARLLRGLLFGVPSGDPASFLVSALLLGLVALVACFIPARRAARVDPLVALRVE